MWIKAKFKKQLVVLCLFPLKQLVKVHYIDMENQVFAVLCEKDQIQRYLVDIVWKVFGAFYVKVKEKRIVCLNYDLRYRNDDKINCLCSPFIIFQNFKVFQKKSKLLKKMFEREEIQYSFLFCGQRRLSKALSPTIPLLCIFKVIIIVFSSYVMLQSIYISKNEPQRSVKHKDIETAHLDKNNIKMILENGRMDFNDLSSASQNFQNVNNIVSRQWNGSSMTGKVQQIIGNDWKVAYDVIQKNSKEKSLNQVLKMPDVANISGF